MTHSVVIEKKYLRLLKFLKGGVFESNGARGSVVG
jgi:hypothetical protein